MAHYKELSDVTVTFNDGEVKVYRISAGPDISGYLAREAGQSGMLSLWDKNRSHGIPVERIRDWTIDAVEIEEPVKTDE